MRTSILKATTWLPCWLQVSGPPPRNLFSLRAGHGRRGPPIDGEVQGGHGDSEPPTEAVEDSRPIMARLEVRVQKCLLLAW